MDKELQTADRVLKALADPTRLRIVGLLRSGEICVCHLYASLKISQPKASRHLAYLRRSGVVRAEKRGLWVYYTLTTELPFSGGRAVGSCGPLHDAPLRPPLATS